MKLRRHSGSLIAASWLLLPAAALSQMPPPLPDRSDLVRITDLREDRTLEIVVGPISLEAGGPHLRTPVQLVSLPVAGWLHGFEWEMRDAAGRALPDRLLHHVNFIDPDRRELFSDIPRRVLAAGRETQKQGMPKFLGYPIVAGTRLLISAMFASVTDEDYPEAYLHVRLSYSLDGNGLFSPRDVYPFYLDVMGPVGAKEFPLPPGRTTRSWEGRPAIDGRILAIGGHVHDFAEWIRLEDVTEGKVVWETAPELDEETGEVVSVPTGRLWWRGGMRIRRDHTYRIVVQYHNPTDAPVPDGGMGALGGIILAGEAEWPPLDRTAAAYAEDLRNTLEAPMRAHDQAEDREAQDGIGRNHGAGEQAPGETRPTDG